MGKTIGAGPADIDKVLQSEVDGADVMGGEFWKPQESGDTIIGEVLVDSVVVGGKYGDQRILQLAVDDGSMCVPVNASLARELSSQEIKVGDHVAIQYRGTVETGAGRAFKTYVARKAK